jgi:hypothetical protein
MHDRATEPARQSFDGVLIVSVSAARRRVTDPVVQLTARMRRTAPLSPLSMSFDRVLGRSLRLTRPWGHRLQLIARPIIGRFERRPRRGTVGGL